MTKEDAEKFALFINECETQEVGTKSTAAAEVVIRNDTYCISVENGYELLETKEQYQGYISCGDCDLHPDFNKYLDQHGL